MNENTQFTDTVANSTPKLVYFIFCLLRSKDQPPSSPFYLNSTDYNVCHSIFPWASLELRRNEESIFDKYCTEEEIQFCTDSSKKVTTAHIAKRSLAKTELPATLLNTEPIHKWIPPQSNLTFLALEIRNKKMNADSFKQIINQIKQTQGPILIQSHDIAGISLAEILGASYELLFTPAPIPFYNEKYPLCSGCDATETCPITQTAACLIIKDQIFHADSPLKLQPKMPLGARFLANIPRYLEIAGNYFFFRILFMINSISFKAARKFVEKLKTAFR